MVAVTFRFSNPSTLRLEVEVLTFKLRAVGVVGTAPAIAAQTMRVARERNIAIEVSKAVGEATRMEVWLVNRFE